MQYKINLWFLFDSDVLKPFNDLAINLILFILSNMDLLSSFLAGFGKQTLGLLKKFGLWSFKVIKQLF